MAAQGKSTERMQIIESMIIRATRAIVSHPLVEDIFVLTLETKDIVRGPIAVTHTNFRGRARSAKPPGMERSVATLISARILT